MTVMPRAVDKAAEIQAKLISERLAGSPTTWRRLPSPLMYANAPGT